MTEERWEEVDEVQGMLQAELLRGLLEAQGIPVWLTQEGAGRAMGLTVGVMGTVQILVPQGSVEKAREVLDGYYSGEFAARGPEVDPRNDSDTPLDYD